MKEQEQEQEIELIKYNKASWTKSFILGIFLGLGVIIPGISGSTIAIIFGLYAQLLFAFGNILKKFKKCVRFLLPIFLGMIVGVAVGFLLIKKLLDILPFAMIGLFAGLMCGAFPAVKEKVQNIQLSKKHYLLIGIGILIPLIISAISIIFGNNDTTAINLSQKPTVGMILLGLPVGYIIAITQVVPGLSATAFLMVIGWFKFLFNTISLTYWQAQPIIFLLYGTMIIGFIIGIITFSKLLTHLFSKMYHTIYLIIIGLSLGSILSMFINPDTMLIYQSWHHSGINVLDLTLAIVLFVLGIITSYYLVLKQRKHDQSEQKA